MLQGLVVGAGANALQAHQRFSIRRSGGAIQLLQVGGDNINTLIHLR
jgi:hypothetical protein